MVVSRQLAVVNGGKLLPWDHFKNTASVALKMLDAQAAAGGMDGLSVVFRMEPIGANVVPKNYDRP